jgi:hypothetical protein
LNSQNATPFALCSHNAIFQAAFLFLAGMVLKIKRLLSVSYRSDYGDGIRRAEQSLSVVSNPKLTQRIVMKIAGIVFIVIGILALIYGGFTYTQTKQDAKIGSLEINHQETHDVPVPPIVGGVFIVAGVAALAIGAKTKS